MKNADLFLMEIEMRKLSNKQLPISLEIAKNLKKINSLISDYKEELTGLNETYGVKNEKGQFIDNEGNPVTDSLKMKMTNQEAFFNDFNDLLQKDVKLDLVSVKGSKKIYDSESKTDKELSKYLPTVLTADELLFLDTHNIVEDILE